ncbi:MAG: hypothetical protein INH43_15875 [Acidobacteriaceae bacterium]|nr:hypothetical protein [Acidobacteriaceae bacterium]
MPSSHSLLPLLSVLATALPAVAEQRFLLAAENQVIEVNRAGRVTSVLKHPGHRNIWDAWRLPDGGIFYVHRDGLAVFDKNNRLILEHPAVRHGNDVEAPGGAVLDGGRHFAMLDSEAAEIRVINRQGTVVSRTHVPDLRPEPVHSRYRMIRPSARGNAFWIVQYARKTLLEVEMGTGKILATIDLAPHLTPTPPAPHLAFATLEPGDGSLYATTATGLQLLRFDAQRHRTGSWTAADLGLATRYLLGMQRLANGNLLLACGDYHMKSTAEGRDQLAEINPGGQVVWKLTRAQLLDQIDGFVDPKTGLEELRITNVHAYDSAKIKDALAGKR